MSPASAPRGRSSAAGQLSIGQVLARLLPDFPGLTASKLRFLEVQGIVTPVRTASGYRKFSNDDVERLRNALTMQRDYGFPLARIREYLDEGETAGVSATPVPASILPPARTYRRGELLKTAGATSALLDDAVRAGLLAAADRYDEHALVVLRGLVALDEHGIEPRHLRGVRQAAERDIALIENALAPLLRRKDAESRAHANEAAPELARRVDELRAVFTQAALDRFTS
ncbi:transcriptional regulator FtsR [Microbacterium sp. No. 7]|uniref:transcriptional regulator FtsR n=1 Tax=Microbacterium sp. No. 7 TaxID=1714373 RepID=UPI0006D06E27|nr:MerR family transcriptional regulator [Microbacterium sp. No. 7]ALJ20830.1 MerR family transcriptional regulator [Microbacterium sp. No. 7]